MENNKTVIFCWPGPEAPASDGYFAFGTSATLQKATKWSRAKKFDIGCLEEDEQEAEIAAGRGDSEWSPFGTWSGPGAEAALVTMDALYVNSLLQGQFTFAKDGYAYMCSLFEKFRLTLGGIIKKYKGFTRQAVDKMREEYQRKYFADPGKKVRNVLVKLNESTHQGKSKAKANADKAIEMSYAVQEQIRSMMSRRATEQALAPPVLEAIEEDIGKLSEATCRLLALTVEVKNEEGAEGVGEEEEMRLVYNSDTSSGSGSYKTAFNTFYIGSSSSD